MTGKKWEEVTVDLKGAGHTYRLRVPGGYLYRTTTYRYPEKHAQWDALVKETGSIRDAVIASKARNNATGGREFTTEWRDQAQEIATQTTVFVRAKKAKKIVKKMYPAAELLTPGYLSADHYDDDLMPGEVEFVPHQKGWNYDDAKGWRYE